MVVPNYTYLKLKMSGPKGVITVKGSFEQAYYYEQDYVIQGAVLITPCAPNGLGRDTRRVPTKEEAKVATVPDHLGPGEVAKTPSGSDGSASPSIQVLSPLEGVDLIKVSSDLSP
jgi:hypothetical protein